ncbi:hypothetical protein BKH41_01800 [Helicobacter sp. 12S02232-10]|uniref:hypothetical protein n=1 Tax=Helicobacter sp. 12S02232-10 TaxID=1476197 RepID=UPI000BA69634|nr:hypothetical protein [Helicobacter sp. 12S02232-10]PAF49426.1 hypothetical protein BKH41_01800 [Helicobacter sp. 12S02232-10]
MRYSIRKEKSQSNIYKTILFYIVGGILIFLFFNLILPNILARVNKYYIIYNNLTDNTTFYYQGKQVITFPKKETTWTIRTDLQKNNIAFIVNDYGQPSMPKVLEIDCVQETGCVTKMNYIVMF